MFSGHLKERVQLGRKNNSVCWSLDGKDQFVVDIAFTLNWFRLQDGPVSIQEKFEYIMYGTLYEIADGLSLSPPEVEITASFGGLQLMLRGDPSHCAKFAVGQKLFLLIRKFES
ncbi:hypothetical protein TSUD_203390 [Trifolium subterraneum]|uniref:DNA-directed RNA polymerases I, II, and III subunit RPABC3 n=1 Tax=Trifolium subterraneum TaxID=3900 RepID=A0A2Z6M3P5_TRISU|nr:hypothetical protein TSUD_203390 [Trifolium subterraneum]